MYNVSIPSLMSVAENVFQEFIGHIIYILFIILKLILKKSNFKTKTKDKY